MQEKLGEFLEKLGKYEAAKTAYCKGHAYQQAVELAHLKFPEEVAVLQEEWGDWLASLNQVDLAINHFMEAGCSMKAIESSIASRNWNKAVQILESQNVNVTLKYHVMLAEHFESVKQYSEAEKLFLDANLAPRAFDMYIFANKWDLASKVVLKHLSEMDARALYLKWGHKFEALGRFEDAENLYIETKEYDLAISMYKKARMFDDMIHLVSKYRKELLPEMHLELAKQFENEGLLQDAEQQYLEIQDWKSTVKMYTTHCMWEDAMRIAKNFGGVVGARQVAYAWALSLGGHNGAQLLAKMGLLEQAIDYAADTRDFDHAFDLCKASFREKLPEVHLKHAMFLEDEGLFKDAEDEFIKAGKPREAIDMYIHQQDWQAANRVAELFEPISTSDVQVAHARVLAENGDFKRAEAILIKERRAELAIIMYKKMNKWEDAIRVADMHIPSKVSGIYSELALFLQSQSGGTETYECVLAKARSFEHNQKFSEAIDCYLQLDVNRVPDVETLYQALNMALTLVKGHNLERLQEVVGIVTKKLEAAELFDKAATILEDVGSYKEAAEMYIRGGQWEKASSLALTSGEHVLQKYIDGLYKEHLLKNGEANLLVKIGSIPEALEVYVQQENWEKVHELAASLGPELEKEFSLRHAACCLQQAKIVEAISVMEQYELPLNGATYELCNYASQQLLRSREENSTFQRTMKELRMLLYHFWDSVRDINDAMSFQVILELERLVTAVTLVTVRFACESQGLLELAAKVSVSLLRHIGLIPADKAFYDAGIACKKVQWYNIGFIFMNAYLDVAEAIDDKDAGLTTEHLFEQSDIPAEFPIPECHSVTEEKREEARDWLIQLSMDEKVEEVLPMRKCDSCGALIFEVSLVCFSCKDKSEACSVTGYPLLQTECMECHHCHKLANKDDWIAYIGAFHSCPWCNKPS